MAKCLLCKNQAIWAMQFLAEDKPTFYILGYHIRGYKVFKVCERCKEETREEFNTTPEKQKALADYFHTKIGKYALLLKEEGIEDAD